MKTVKTVKMKRVMSLVLAFSLVIELIVGVAGTPITVHAAGTAAELLSVAAGQVGYHEKASNASLDNFTANSGSANYTKYARDIGVANGYAWCATFVWWCMQTAGVNSSNYPRVTYATKNWFKSRGLWHDRGTYTPKAGDYIAFGTSPNHCGIVESVTGNTVNTIEGNSGDKVARHSYSLSSTYIMGYGTIKYDSSPTPTTTDTSNPGSPYPIPTTNLKNGSSGNSVKWVQMCLNATLGSTLVIDGKYGAATAWTVKEFQRYNGLTVDGIVGTNTTNKMLAVWRGKVNPTTTTPATTTQKATTTTQVTTTQKATTQQTTEQTTTTQQSTTENVLTTEENVATEATVGTQEEETDDVTVTESTESTQKEVMAESDVALQDKETTEPTEEVLDETASGNAGDRQDTAGTTESSSTAKEKSATAQSVFSMSDESDELVADEDDDSVEIDKAKIKSIKNIKRKSIRISLAELDDVDGYEISIVRADKSTLNKLKKQLRNGDTITVSGLKKARTKSTKIKINKLKKNKTYYVFVRGYANVNNEKIYGEYSQIKKVTIRR